MAAKSALSGCTGLLSVYIIPSIDINYKHNSGPWHWDQAWLKKIFVFWFYLVRGGA